MIRITDSIAINEREIQEDFVRSSGPGGQNVNKVATAVQLRFRVVDSPSLPPDVRARLMTRAGNRMTDEGVLIIDARRFRTQERNRRDAMERLAALIRKAAIAPRTRRKTRPSPEAKKRRVEVKRQRSTLKKLRRPVGGSDE